MTADNSTSFYQMNAWGEVVEAPEDAPDLTRRYLLQANILISEKGDAWESLSSYAAAWEALLGCSECVETFRAMVGGGYLDGDADIEQVVSVRIWDSRSRRVILWEDDERRVCADGRIFPGPRKPGPQPRHT